MPAESDGDGLQRELEALQADHPELDALSALVLLALRRHSAGGASRGLNTALLARRLDIEHALIRRAAADLEDRGWLTSEPAGGASPALRLTLAAPPRGG